MTLDPGKPYAAEHGRPVRIVSTDGKGDYPIAAWHFRFDNEQEIIIQHRADGTCNLAGYDLYNIPERQITELILRRHDGLTWATETPPITGEKVEYEIGRFLVTTEDDRIVSVENAK